MEKGKTPTDPRLPSLLVSNRDTSIPKNLASPQSVASSILFSFFFFSILAHPSEWFHKHHEILTKIGRVEVLLRGIHQYQQRLTKYLHEYQSKQQQLHISLKTSSFSQLDLLYYRDSLETLRELQMIDKCESLFWKWMVGKRDFPENEVLILSIGRHT
jgi:hypothetical protein